MNGDRRKGGHDEHVQSNRTTTQRHNERDRTLALALALSFVLALLFALAGAHGDERDPQRVLIHVHLLRSQTMMPQIITWHHSSFV